MKQANIALAYKRLTEINKTVGLPYATCKKLFSAKLALRPHIECQAERERVLLAASADENGNTDYNNPTVRKGLAEIMNTEVEWTAEPIKIQLTRYEMDQINFTAEMMDDLAGFVDFEEVKTDD